MNRFNPSSELRRVSRPGAVRAALVIYGVGFTLYAVLHLAAALPNHEVLMATRSDGISASIAVLDRGGPPLLGANVPYGSVGAQPAKNYFPVGVSDDQGLYLYLPLIARATGQDNPNILLKWFFIGCFALLFAVYPLLFYELMGSVLAAVAAPILVLHWFSFLRNTDLYWIVGWGALLGLPLVFAALKRPWGKGAIALLLAAGLVASFVTSVRIHSGDPIMIAAIAVALIRARSFRSKALASIAIVVATLSINVGVLGAVRIARDTTVGVAFRHKSPSEHPTWHNAYIGLGYLPNKYGITWDDNVARAAAHNADPQASYLSSEYERTLRHLYFKIFRHDPWFVLGTFWTKFGVCIQGASRQFGWWWPFFLVLPLLLGRRRREMRWFVGLSLPALAFAIVPPIVTFPFSKYQAGWFAAVGFLWLLLITWALSSLPDAARWLNFDRSNWRSVLPSGQAAALAAAACVALIAVARTAVTHADAAVARAAAPPQQPAPGQAISIPTTLRQYYVQNANALSPASVNGQKLGSWSFATGLAADWSKLTASVLDVHGGQTTVTTRPSVGEYQLWSAPRVLRSGIYEIVVDGSVLAGGLSLGAIDVGTQAWIAQRNYWSGEPFADGKMTTRLALDAATNVQIILANWASTAHASRWRIKDVRLVRTSLP